ncbi:BrnA antitoxin family protein [Modicisalibacter tunisiensis]|uniref:BrnA antitoxin family protein n=1 Tax=Modicisalibacter tunisiensis TaxID=390637 RepID=A0ABS7WW39_9GAMM|nr:BrnA antitoxin family protein [Modicisalibacter tunisiensis]MBZ9539794.1 BrnA antitoxin family protein [Modicisalibacter tunisiensis]MBZ9566817.1 BrnA antitoxin family protein [Modicisalibacter tunisiensis]
MSKRLTDKEGEVRELTDQDVKQMRPMSDVLPADLQRTIRQQGQRGPQQAPTKVKTTMRLSPDVVDHFKAQGPGWQRRIDQALREYIREHG